MLRRLHVGLLPLALLIVGASVCFVVASRFGQRPDFGPDGCPGDCPDYALRFYEAIAKADRIVMRESWFDSEGKYRTVLQVDDPADVNDLRRRLRFVPEAPEFQCACTGLDIYWYHGTALVAKMSLNHETVIRWWGFSGDACLTGHSVEQVRQWFKEHNLIQAEPGSDLWVSHSGSEE